MKEKLYYQTPGVLRQVPVNPRGNLMQGSVTDTTNIRTAGQGIDGFYDISDEHSSFNHSWE